MLTLWNFFLHCFLPILSPLDRRRDLWKKSCIICYSLHHIAPVAAHQPKCGLCLAFVSPPFSHNMLCTCPAILDFKVLLHSRLFYSCFLWLGHGLSGRSTLTSLQHNSPFFQFSKMFFPSRCLSRPRIWPGPASVCGESPLCISQLFTCISHWHVSLE